MRRLALLSIAVAAGGCFYDGDLNDRPSAEIVRLTPGVPLRGATVELQGVVVDPGDLVTTTWRVDACGHDAAGAELCDQGIAFRRMEPDHIAVEIPLVVDADGARRPTESLVVHLDVTDSHGAVARPSQRAVVEVGNLAPMIVVQRRGREGASAFPEDAPILVAARATDPEGDEVALDCQPFPARGAVPGAWSWVRLADPASGGREWRLVPDVPGAWTVRCIAADELTETTTDLPILVVADRPPCLGETDPRPAPGVTVILDGPRVFSVASVEDDLDEYPAPAPDDPFLGAAGLRWSVRPVGDAAFVEVDADVGALELDPARWAPGDRFDVRLEIDDRRHRAIGCPIDAPTCSLTLDNCLQRQTWRVEVR